MTLNKMRLSASIIYVFLLTTGGAKKNPRSRVRRYLAFPEGAVFSSVFCLTNLMGITPGSDIFSLNINWGLTYELPNDTRPLLDIYKPAVKRRHRRDIYRGVEKILDSMGYDGRSCILRSLCEAEKRLSPSENLLYRVLSLIFRFPQEPLLDTEPEVHYTYHFASQFGKNEPATEYHEDWLDKCSETFTCPFSLIDVALGYYSVEGDTYT